VSGDHELISSLLAKLLSAAPTEENKRALLEKAWAIALDDALWVSYEAEVNASRPRTQGHLFPMGQLSATPGALAAMGADQPEGMLLMAELLNRHASGDWGIAPPEDKEVNAEALREGLRLMSVYVLPDSMAEVWVITEADRSVTTILLPDEY
jgi:hypothetical protein